MKHIKKAHISRRYCSRTTAAGSRQGGLHGLQSGLQGGLQGGWNRSAEEFVAFLKQLSSMPGTAVFECL